MRIFVLLLMASVLSFGQSSSVAKKPSGAAAPLLVSDPVRDIGHLYLSALDDALDEAMKQHFAQMRAKVAVDKGQMELVDYLNMPDGLSIDRTSAGKRLDEYEYQIRRAKKTPGDEKFYDLLKFARTIREISYQQILRKDPTFASMTPHPSVAALDAQCIGTASGVVESGKFSDAGCSQADFNAANSKDEALEGALTHTPATHP